MAAPADREETNGTSGSGQEQSKNKRPLCCVLEACKLMAVNLAAGHEARRELVNFTVCDPGVDPGVIGTSHRCRGVGPDPHLRATDPTGAADLDRAGDRGAAERCRQPAGAARARSHHRHLRPCRAGGRRPRQALRRQQSRLRQLPSRGRHQEVRHPAVRAVLDVPGIHRPRRRRDHARGSSQRLHDAQHERAAHAERFAGDAGDRRLHQVPFDRRGAGRGALGPRRRPDAGARPRRRSRAREDRSTPPPASPATTPTAAASAAACRPPISAT